MKCLGGNAKYLSPLVTPSAKTDPNLGVLKYPELRAVATYTPVSVRDILIPRCWCPFSVGRIQKCSTLVLTSLFLEEMRHRSGFV